MQWLHTLAVDEQRLQKHVHNLWPQPIDGLQDVLQPTVGCGPSWAPAHHGLQHRPIMIYYHLYQCK